MPLFSSVPASELDVVSPTAAELAKEKRENRAKLKLLLLDRIAIGLFLVAVGYFVSTQLDLAKSEAARHQERIRERRDTIRRQLEVLYRPFQMRMNLDDSLWRRGDMSDADEKYAWAIRAKVVLNNHMEALDLMMRNGALIQNNWESPDDPTVAALRKQIEKYQIHVAIFQALVEVGSKDFPIVKREQFPPDLTRLVTQRIDELTKQYRDAEENTP